MSWGGARIGAGRPKSRPIASERHGVRPALSPRHPVRVTLRTLVRGLRRRAAYRAIRRATATSFARSDFRIVQLVAKNARLELLVEADDKLALARGLQGFQVACARALNRAHDRAGTVFPDRYRAAILATRAAVRRAVSELSPAPRVCRPITWLLRIEANKPDMKLSFG